MISAAFFLSGATALVYEVVWSRYLTLFLGASSPAQALVLATFMGGLAAGNALFGRIADRAGMDRVRLYAFLELGVGLLCVLFPSAFGLLSEGYVALASRLEPGAPLSFVLKLGLAGAVVLLPCTLLGGTLPVLARHLIGSRAAVGPRVSWLYFVNTAGAVLGCLLAGFVLVERLGLEATMLAGSLVNTGIGAVFYAVSWRRRRAAGGGLAHPEPATAGPPEGKEHTRAQARAAVWAIAVAGSLSMLYELSWVRLLSLSLGPTVHSFSTMLASFISGIALGSFAAGRLLSRPRDALALLGLCELLIGLFVLATLPLGEMLPFAFFRAGTAIEHAPQTYGLFLIAQVAFALLVMLVPTTLMGAALPLASRVCVERVEAAGAEVGGVFSANTVGTVVGSLLTGFVLLPRLGLERTLLCGALLSGLLGVALLRAWRPAGAGSAAAGLRDALAATAVPHGPPLWKPALLGFALLFAGFGLARPAWDPRLLQSGLYLWERGLRLPALADFLRMSRARTFLYSKDGADASVAVEEVKGVGRQMLVNGKPDASAGFDLPTQLMVGHLGLLLHPAPRRVMIVGLGSGTTAGAALRHPGVEAEVAEISPEVIEAARYFDSVNDRVLANPRLSLRLIDARELLLLTRDRYDVIVSEPTNLWVPGISNLFTRQFHALARSRLAPGGVFVQWIHLYSIDRPSVASVLVSLQEAFGHVTGWVVGDGDLLLVAAEARPAFDPGSFARRLAELRAADGLPAGHAGLAVFRHPVLFLASQVLTDPGIRTTWPAKDSPPPSDLLPRLEFAAARAQFLARRYRLTEEVDERLRRVGSEPLLLEQLLARFPLDGDDRRRLASVLIALGPGLAPIGRALALAAVLEGDPDPSLPPLLPEAVLGRVSSWLARGAALDRASAPPPELCRDYAREDAALRAEAGPVFGPPSAARSAARLSRCAP